MLYVILCSALNPLAPCSSAAQYTRLQTHSIPFSLTTTLDYIVCSHLLFAVGLIVVRSIAFDTLVMTTIYAARRRHFWLHCDRLTSCMYCFVYCLFLNENWPVISERQH